MSHDFVDQFRERGEYVLDVINTTTNKDREDLVGGYFSIKGGSTFKVVDWDNSGTSGASYVVEFADGRRSQLDERHIEEALSRGQLCRVRFRKLAFDELIEFWTDAAVVASLILLEEWGITHRDGAPETEPVIEALSQVIRAGDQQAIDPIGRIESLRAALEMFIEHEHGTAQFLAGGRGRVRQEQKLREGNANWFRGILVGRNTVYPCSDRREEAIALMDARNPIAIAPHG